MTVVTFGMNKHKVLNLHSENREEVPPHVKTVLLCYGGCTVYIYIYTNTHTCTHTCVCVCVCFYICVGVRLNNKCSLCSLDLQSDPSMVWPMMTNSCQLARVQVISLFMIKYSVAEENQDVVFMDIITGVRLQSER